MRPSNHSYFQPVSPWIMAAIIAVLAVGSEGCYRGGTAPSGGDAMLGGAPQGAPSGAEKQGSRGKTGKDAVAGSKDSLGKGTVAGGANVAGAGTGSGSTSTAAEPAAKPEPPKPECFTMSFKHKALAAHRDGEACLSHDNAFKIPHERLNTRTLCVRVNGTPVKHRLVKNKPGVVMIGSVAGPESLVTVRWCTDKTTCKEDCSVPKDEFMDAIGGMGGGDSYVQWDPSEGKKGPSEDEKRLEKELQAFGGGKNEIFDQWIAEREPKLTCGTEKERSVAHR